MTPIQKIIQDLPTEFHALMPKLLGLLAEERYMVIDAFDKAQEDIMTGTNTFHNGEDYYNANFSNRDLPGYSGSLQSGI
jgi:hypothetical protein